MTANDSIRTAAVLSFDVDAESAILAKGRRYADHAMVMTHQAFGPRVGVGRILSLLTEYQLPGTFFIPGLTADRYPETVAQVLEAGHEVAHHSWSHRSAIDLGSDGERADFERALEALHRAGAQEIKGHRAASWEASWGTPGLVAKHGLIYDSSLMDADTPYVLETDRGTIAELPPFWGLDDWAQYAFLPRPQIGDNVRSPRVVADMWVHELDAMRRHNALFILTCHPFISGRAGRIEALRILIEAALDRGDVDFHSAASLATATLNRADVPRKTVKPVVVSDDDYPEW